jgi:cystinosin
MQRGNQRVSLACYALLAVFGIFACVSTVLALVQTINWLLFMQFISYIKLAITLVKYMPQVHNYNAAAN